MRTARLTLRPLPARAAGALPGDRGGASRALGAALHPDWPQSDLLDLLPLLVAAGPHGEHFGAWVVIERETNTVVGDIGFHGPPATDGSIEIGYSVVPDRRHRGYATEAARALVVWALGQPEVTAVVARCDADSEASIRTLERVGFTRTGDADRQLRWRYAH